MRWSDDLYLVAHYGYGLDIGNTMGLVPLRILMSRHTMWYPDIYVIEFSHLNDFIKNSCNRESANTSCTADNDHHYSKPLLS